MAVVTGFTAERMLGIENTTVTSGLVDGNGNLILYTREGTPIDAGYIKGDPAAVPIAYRLASAASSTYPDGASYFAVGTTFDDWPIGTATVLTVRSSANRTFQQLVNKLSGRVWFRAEGDADAWGAWSEMNEWANLRNKPSTFAPIIGAASNQAVAGNDVRLTNARTPTAHDASLITSGTLADARLPTRLMASAQDISNLNLNSYIDTGWYKGNAVTNAPTSNWYYFEIIKHASTWVYQRAVGFGPYTGHVRTTWQRWLSNNIWQAWEPVYSSDSEINSLADARIAIAKPLINGHIMSLVRNSYSALTSLVNRGGFVSASNATIITIPKTGNYQINFAMLVAVASAMYFKLVINGNVDYHGYTPGGTGGVMLDMRVHVERYLTSGTTIQLGIDTNDTAVSSWTGVTPHNDFSIAFTGE